MVSIGSIIILIIKEFLEGLLDEFGEFLFNLTDLGLFSEKELERMGFRGFEDLFKVFLYTGISLLVLKFLKKGFEIYILGTDGDPDSEPIVFIVNFFKAMAISLAFPEVYGWFANIINSLTNNAINAIGLGETSMSMDFLSGILSKGFFLVVFTLAYIVFYLMFYLKFLKVGLQVLILRTGLPLACSGLMDSDRGVFRPYIQKFLQVGITILLQIVLAKISLALFLSGHLLWGFAALLFATNTPRFLQEFLIVSEGGNGSTVYKAQAGVRLVQTIRSFVK